MMINFLVVDDVIANVEILELMIVDYMEEKNIDEDKFTILTAKNGQEAVNLVDVNSFDMIFLDIMMPVMNGIDALNHVRQMKIEKQPVIVMATALGDSVTKEKEKKGGANAYVVKPFGDKTINLILDHYLNKIIDHSIEDDDFFDFDDMEGLDEEHAIDNQQVIMEQFNKSHTKLSSEDLLREYGYLKDELYMDLEDIDWLIMNRFNLEEDTLDLDIMLKDIKEVFKLFSSFLYQFSEFEELSKAISSIEELISNVDMDDLKEDNKELLGMYIKAIVMDLIDWKEHVFIKQDAGDVFYANASLLSSYIEVKKLLQ
ncbi:MAG: response regulator [Campylobacteraceae bacterium]|nr:response regulator [Campylobacteraceae bacterium]